MPDLSSICSLHYCSWQLRILNPLVEARERTYILMDASQICFHWWELLKVHFWNENPFPFLRNTEPERHLGISSRMHIIHLLQHWDKGRGSAAAEEMKLVRLAVLKLCEGITWEFRNANSLASCQTYRIGSSRGWGPENMSYQVLAGLRTTGLD